MVAGRELPFSQDALYVREEGDLAGAAAGIAIGQFGRIRFRKSNEMPSPRVLKKATIGK